MADFSHLTSSGLGAMVDVSAKAETSRQAYVIGEVRVSKDCAAELKEKELEEIIRTARIAAISGAKQTSSLIPYCHQIPLSKVDVDIQFEEKHGKFLITTVTKTKAPTGVEMEALTAASLAGLTIYDMIKAVDPGATVGPFKLTRKEGGKAGTWINRTTSNH